ncbi:uncharacterized protein LOC108032861 isoform X2 [Drosophila biarmipes]|uniref:uncharacterized protein LOC108032861 isoform X2 n=1 Tax=Drosophila biarmipes TaxID=125945 RepID=UPI0021CCD83D|nr:uncharacterized protein LOC108032861 isoform X2 [Drosophila biarmipes]
MFVTPGKLTVLLRGRLPVVFFYVKKRIVQELCCSVALGNYNEANPIPLPIDVDAAKTRDFSSIVIPSHGPTSNINITTDKSLSTLLSSLNCCQDFRVHSYDSFGLSSVRSAMHRNLLMPFGGFNQFTHLNMHGGQCSQKYNFIAQNMQFSLYSGTRNSLRADWVTYDQNVTLGSYDQGVYKSEPAGSDNYIL